MTITWTQVAAIPFIAGGCGPQGITCMGQNRMLASVEETPLNPADPNLARMFLSTNNGLTWTEIETLFSLDNLNVGRLRCTGLLNRVLTGMLGPQMLAGAYEPGASVIARTVNGGHAWASAVTAAEYAADNFEVDGWTVQDFIVTDFGVLFAVGWLGLFGATKPAMRSTDGGATFTSPTPLSPLVFALGSETGMYLGAGVLIVGETGANPLNIARSSDQGVTWTRIALDVTQQGTPHGGCLIGTLGGGAGIVCGQQAPAGGGGFPLFPFAFYTADAGATWTRSTILGGATAAPLGAVDVIAPSTLNVVLGMSATIATMGGGGSPFRLSIDGGQTFLDQGVQATPFLPGNRYDVRQLAIADDGAVLAIVSTINALQNQATEIWRGVIDGFAGPGPCAAFGAG